MAEPPSPFLFTDEPMHAVISALRARLETNPTEVLELRVLDPDHGQGRMAGERFEQGGTFHRYRPFKTWVDLAERLGCRLLTPTRQTPWVHLRLEPFTEGARTPSERARTKERYGAASGFGAVQKLEEPCFLLDYSEALERAKPPPGGRVLDLGVNTGDELAHLFTQVGAEDASTLQVTGIDHAASALEVARARFPGGNIRFVEADIGALSDLALGRFDLVISVATLQSPDVDGRETVRRLVQQHVTPRGAFILGFPNCRYRGGEVIYGARMKNFRESELSLLLKDVMFYKKYLQQHRFKVFLTGKYYLFLTAVRGA